MPENDNDFCDYWAPPAWLNETFFSEIIRNYENDKSVEIISMKIIPAVMKGDSYASCMYRIKFCYSGIKIGEKTVQLICKTTNIDEFANKILTEQKAYQTEMYMYETVLPELHNILESAKDNDSLSPKTIYINQKENAIIFEDLKELKYFMAPRLNGLDKTHANMVLKKMAKLHASSAIYNQNNNNELPEKFNMGMYNRVTDGITPVFLTNLEALAKEVFSWQKWEYYGKKLEKMTENMVETGKKTFDVNENDFNCLLHGDLWINNIMFKYNDKNQPIDLKMIDFQYCVWGSPGIDVLYFLCTSLNDELRENNQDEFIQFYHTCLEKYLKKLKYKGVIPTLLDIQIQFLKKFFYAFTSTCLVLPMMISEHANGADFRTVFGVDNYSHEFKRKIYQNDRMKKIIKCFLPMFDRKGILDL